MMILQVGGETSNILYFHPETWGNDPIWRAYFSNGLKPPTGLIWAGQSITTNPPVGHPKCWFSTGISQTSPKHSGLGIIVLCPDVFEETHGFCVKWTLVHTHTAWIHVKIKQSNGFMKWKTPPAHVFSFRIIWLIGFPEEINRSLTWRLKGNTWIFLFVCEICAFSPKNLYQKGRIFTYLEDPGIFRILSSTIRELNFFLRLQIAGPKKVCSLSLTISKSHLNQVSS